MSDKKIRTLTIFGTRPEAIKMAPVVRTLAARPQEFDSVVCVTSQHREMLRQVLEVFEITPDFDLDLMRPNQNLFDITEGVLQGLRPVLEQVQPEVALVHGDTTTTFAASLACYYCGIPVGHVEAGLRTRDKRQPFPEEINRRLADVICDLHFAPTTVNQQNLLAEGQPAEGIVVTGNTVVDALLSILPKARQQRAAIAGLEGIDWSLKTVLVTCHRRESFGQQLEDICQALRTIVEQLPEVNLVYPVHRNPNVLGPVTRLLGDTPRIYLTEPLEYLPFVWLMDRSYLVLTDSGGIQEEAPALDKPVLVMRNKTERNEAVTSGAVILTGTDRERIVQQVTRLVRDPAAYQQMARAENPYGDGKAAERIAEALLRRFRASP